MYLDQVEHLLVLRFAELCYWHRFVFKSIYRTRLQTSLLFLIWASVTEANVYYLFLVLLNSLSVGPCKSFLLFWFTERALNIWLIMASWEFFCELYQGSLKVWWFVGLPFRPESGSVYGNSTIDYSRWKLDVTIWL